MQVRIGPIARTDSSGEKHDLEIVLLRGGHYGISIEVEGFKAHGGGTDRRFNIEPQGIRRLSLEIQMAILPPSRKMRL